MKDDRSSTAAEAGASAVPSPSSETLTERQRRVLEVIRDSVTERGYPPSIREIGDAVGLTSTSSVAHQLRTLERKGFLRRDPNRPRAVDVRGLDEVAADTAIASVSPIRRLAKVNGAVGFGREARTAASDAGMPGEQLVVPDANVPLLTKLIAIASSWGL